MKYHTKEALLKYLSDVRYIADLRAELATLEAAITEYEDCEDDDVDGTTLYISLSRRALDIRYTIHNIESNLLDFEHELLYDGE